MFKMSHIAILGLGNWGTALAKTWLDAKHEVSGWTIEKEVYEFQSSGVAMAMYNTDESIRDFARSCMNYALMREWPVYLSIRVYRKIASP